jgi:hypothetical protein
MTTDPPEGLHEREYAIYILEEILGWPAKSNLELMADCLRSIGISRRIKPVQAYKYMLRAIKLAKEQGITVDRFFFMEGKYTEVRPEKQNGLPLYRPIDWESVAREQASPEWQSRHSGDRKDRRNRRRSRHTDSSDSGSSTKKERTIYVETKRPGRPCGKKGECVLCTILA